MQHGQNFCASVEHAVVNDIREPAQLRSSRALIDNRTKLGACPNVFEQLLSSAHKLLTQAAPPLVVPVTSVEQIG